MEAKMEKRMKPNYEKAGGVPTEVCMWTQELSPLQK